MKFDFANVLVFVVIGVGFLTVTLFLSSLLRPHHPDREKNSTYECGERPIGKAWFNFNPRFYLVALVFVIFDVEIVFIFPVAVVLKSWIAAGNGTLALIEIATFVAILAVGLAYVWAKGDLEWVKKVRGREVEATDHLDKLLASREKGMTGPAGVRTYKKA
ncbi:MAG: NADH-quinone oxidoreductase subunit A [Deltaproteobacteria bacterium]|nr:NADH-quinone oxidoreductase subunit A [Deltaproteobacteria bacterium]